MKFKDKVVLITGSSSGIGASTALKFAKEGAKVVVNSRSNSVGGKDIVNKIKKLGSEAIYVQADVSKPEEVKELFRKSVKAFGTVDILINNVGEAKGKKFLEITKNDLVEALENNLFGAIYCSQEAAKIMTQKGSGKIVNVSTISSLNQGPHTSILPYTLAKSALNTFTIALAKILSPKIIVNAVAPGYTYTPYYGDMSKEAQKELIDSTLIKRYINVEEIAEAILFLASSDVTTGEILIVDGGASIK